MTQRLVVVSNRVAVPEKNKKAQAGGLAVALQEALEAHGGVWFGWSGKVSAQKPEKPTIQQQGQVTYATVDLTRKAYNEYYSGFANRTLWPLFHYRIDLTAFTKENYSGYLKTNQIFANELRPMIGDEDLIWVHDYHLIPLGEELRKLGVERPMGFFLHTPFPAMEILTTLPGHRALVEALCAYDVVGFQTDNDLRAFLDYVVHEAGGGIMGGHIVHAFGRTLRVEVFPIGIETESFISLGLDSSRTGRDRTVRRERDHDHWIIGVDRLDYSKGLPQRFQAFERFLEDHKKFRGHVTLMQVAPPSRSEVPEYKQIREELEGLAGHINGRFAEFDWLPINYLNRSYERRDLVAFYRASQIGLVTPLRDGMNLVAKEYVAAQNPHNPGVLVLSRFAGAARELSAALIVNPFDLDAVAAAIARGLEMPLEERRERWADMMEKLRANTLSNWTSRFLVALRNAPYDT